MFQSAQDVGLFVERIRGIMSSDEGLPLGVSPSIIDMAVYTNNRCLRLVLSAKFAELGKRHLLSFDSNSETVRTRSEVDLQDFVNSLASTAYSKSSNSSLKKINVSSHHLNTSLQIPVKKSFRKRTEKRLNASKVQNRHSGKVSHWKLKSTNPIVKRVIDFFKLTVLPKWPLPLFPGQHERVSKAYLSKVTECFDREGNLHKLLLNVGGNRFCYNIKRQHKSNHIYFVVDIAEGSYYQRCHDITCRRFMSQKLRLFSGN